MCRRNSNLKEVEDVSEGCLVNTGGLTRWCCHARMPLGVVLPCMDAISGGVTIQCI